MPLDLNKALRAMQYTEDWTNSVQAACLFAGKEYGPDVLQAMTLEFLNDLEYNPETLVVTVPVSIGNPLLEAVQAWEPTNPEPVTVPKPEAVEVQVTERLTAIETSLAALTGLLTDQAAVVDTGIVVD